MLPEQSSHQEYAHFVQTLLAIVYPKGPPPIHAHVATMIMLVDLTPMRKIVEKIALRIFEMEMNLEVESKIWAWRKASWAIDDLERPISEISDLTEISGIGPKLAEEIRKGLKAL